MKDNQVKVSIIVPVYNTDRYLDRCMNSLLNQTLKNIEIIVVDDGSGSECAKKCDQWGKKDFRVHIIHKKNQGLGLARNTGIEASKGKYLLFIDSDDYVEAEMCRKLYEVAEKEKADIIIGGYKKVYQDGKMEACTNQGIPGVLKDEEIKSILLANMLGAPPHYGSDDYIGMSVWKNLYRRDLIERYQIYFPSEREYISEDIIFHIFYLRHVSKAVVIPDTFYCYCQNGSSLTTTYRENRFEMVKKLYLYEEKLLKEIDAYQYGRLQLMRTFIANVRVCIMQEADHGRKNYCGSNAKKRILGFCKDETLKKVLREYPYGKLPIKQRLFTAFMKRENAKILHILASLQNYINRNKKG